MVVVFLSFSLFKLLPKHTHKSLKEKHTSSNFISSAVMEFHESAKCLHLSVYFACLFAHNLHIWWIFDCCEGRSKGKNNKTERWKYELSSSGGYIFAKLVCAHRLKPEIVCEAFNPVRISILLNLSLSETFGHFRQEKASLAHDVVVQWSTSISTTHVLYPCLHQCSSFPWHDPVALSVPSLLWAANYTAIQCSPSSYVWIGYLLHISTNIEARTVQLKWENLCLCLRWSANSTVDATESEAACLSQNCQKNIQETTRVESDPIWPITPIHEKAKHNSQMGPFKMLEKLSCKGGCISNELAAAMEILMNISSWPFQNKNRWFMFNMQIEGGIGHIASAEKCTSARNWSWYRQTSLCYLIKVYFPCVHVKHKRIIFEERKISWTQ